MFFFGDGRAIAEPTCLQRLGSGEQSLDSEVFSVYDRLGLKIDRTSWCLMKFCVDKIGKVDVSEMTFPRFVRTKIM